MRQLWNGGKMHESELQSSTLQAEHGVALSATAPQWPPRFHSEISKSLQLQLLAVPRMLADVFDRKARVTNRDQQARVRVGTSIWPDLRRPPSKRRLLGLIWQAQ